MYILGLNAYHGDCSACLFKDGNIVAAIEEERLTRVKHAAGFPINSIKFCLNKENILLRDVHYVAVNRNPNLRLFSKSLYALKNIFKISKFNNRVKNLKKINSLDKEFQNHFGEKLRNKVILIDHHMAHASSSVTMSKFNECNYITLDGFGDFVSTTIGSYKRGELKKYKEVQFPHSMGLFYTAITQYLGFKNYGDEYKVMGLSSYGKPFYKDKIYELINYDKKNLFKLNLKYFKHHDEGIEMSWLEGEPKISNIYNDRIFNLLGEERKINEKISEFHMNIASSAQTVFEEIAIKIMNKLYEINPSENISLSGGCAMNSVMNGKIKKQTKYKNIYINHSPGDSGGCIGAATEAIKKIKKNTKIVVSDSPYLGSSYSLSDIKKIVLNYRKTFDEKNILVKLISDRNLLFKDIAKSLVDKNVIGLFQGAMEFGARALGNRSIIADPRNAGIKELLNEKIKNREKFRPFAPSILEEDVSNWFDINDNVNFMSKVYKINENKKNIVPGVVHVDGTCRLQTVSKSYNENYYKIIKEFKELTNVPMILNTSFNENEPIVCSPREAIDCFLRTKMDKLYIEKYLIYRN